MYGTGPAGNDRIGRLPVNLLGQVSWPSGCGSARASNSLQPNCKKRNNLGERFQNSQAQSAASALWMSSIKCTKNATVFRRRTEIRGKSRSNRQEHGRSRTRRVFTNYVHLWNLEHVALPEGWEPMK